MLYHKGVERSIAKEGLSLRQRRRRKRVSHLRVARERPVAENQTWAVDFIQDSLISGRHFRAFIRSEFNLQKGSTLST